jgi:hypothetical protein
MDTYEDVVKCEEDTKLEGIPAWGRFLSDGSAIERVRGGKLLLYKPDENEHIDIEHTIDGNRYEPGCLDAQVEDSLRFPDRTEDFGTVEDLLRSLSERIAVYVPLDGPTRLLVAGFVLSTWVVDCLPTAPVLNLWGPPGSENPLIDVLSRLCRRPLRLTEPTVRELSLLPQDLSPTIIVKRPSQRTLGQLLRAATEREFSILRSGRLINLQCAIVAYTEEPLAGTVLRVPLLGAASNYRALGRAEAQQLSDHFPPRLLRYRLSRHPKIANSQFDHPGFAPEVRPLACLLGACTEGDPGAQNKILAALRGIDEGSKVEQSQVPAAAVLEALLVLCHENKKAAFIFEVTELANGILLGRHDGLELTPKVVGGIVRSQLGLSPRRRGPGYELALTGDIPKQIHRLAQVWGVLSLQQPHAQCPFCSEVSPAKCEIDVQEIEVHEAKNS